MNLISNIWNNPKTSVTGLLIATVAVAGALTQQGISLGHAGTGTVVTLISAVATALLGLLARDPRPVAATSGAGSTAKLGGLMLCSLAVMGSLPMTGCTGTSVAQNIVNWTPALQGAVATVDSTASLLDPADAPVFTAATVGFDAGSNLLVAAAKAYLANPTASVLTQLQAQVVTFQQQVNASLLAAARIVNPTSQNHALSAINGVATIINAIFALVEAVSGKAIVAALATPSTITLAEVKPYLDQELAARIVAQHYGEPIPAARAQVAEGEAFEAAAGF